MTGPCSDNTGSGKQEQWIPFLHGAFFGSLGQMLCLEVLDIQQEDNDAWDWFKKRLWRICALPTVLDVIFSQMT